MCCVFTVVIWSEFLITTTTGKTHPTLPFSSLIVMLASLYTVVYMVSLVEISSYVNSRPDMKSIKAHWEDRFHVAVDNNETIIGTIAFAEKKNIHWKGFPVEGKTIEINFGLICYVSFSILYIILINLNGILPTSNN